VGASKLGIDRGAKDPDVRHHGRMVAALAVAVLVVGPERVSGQAIVRRQTLGGR
jgi:hypothetical protein